MNAAGVGPGRLSLGQVVSHVQGVCLDCPRKGAASLCDDFGRCPVGVARRLMSDHLRNGHRVLARVDLSRMPSLPPGVVVEERALATCFEVMPNLCGRCSAHCERCFLNIVYMLLERAVCRARPKPAEVGLAAVARRRLA